MGDGVGVTTDLAAWLIAQIAEDEQLAVAQQMAPASSPHWEVRPADHPTGVYESGRIYQVLVDENAPVEFLAYIAHWDPARVLAECDTKRKLIEMFPTSGPNMEYGGFAGFQARDCGEHRTVGPHRAWCHDCAEWCYPAVPCVRCHGVSDVLREMAVVYKDRPGYVAEWAPDGR